jgi:hypothetical protein
MASTIVTARRWVDCVESNSFPLVPHSPLALGRAPHEPCTPPTSHLQKHNDNPRNPRCLLQNHFAAATLTPVTLSRSILDNNFGAVDRCNGRLRSGRRISPKNSGLASFSCTRRPLIRT